MSIYWMNATDPASLCGVGIDAAARLPRRVPGTHLVFRGPQLVIVSNRLGRDLSIELSAEDPDLMAVLDVLRHLLSRQREPLRRITIETINGQRASGSAYLGVLRSVFDVTTDYKRLILFAKLG